MSKTPLIYNILWSDILVVAQFRAREGDLGVWAWFYKTAEELQLPLRMITKPDDTVLAYRSPCIARICQELPPEVLETLNMLWFEFEFRRNVCSSHMYQWYQVLQGYDVDWWGHRVCNLGEGWNLNAIRTPDQAARPVPEFVKV